MGRTGGVLWLWYCVRCIQSQFYVLKGDADQRIGLHLSTTGHDTKAARVEA